jgi:hypothetical protein
MKPYLTWPAVEVWLLDPRQSDTQIHANIHYRRVNNQGKSEYQWSIEGVDGKNHTQLYIRDAEYINSIIEGTTPPPQKLKTTA